MKALRLALCLMLAALLCGCSASEEPVQPASLLVGYSQLGSESAFRLRNSQDMQDAAKRHGITLALEELESTLSTDGHLSENIRLEELKQSINRFLRQCKERDRNVFIRRYFFCEEIEQIAEEYALTRENVTQILHRTRERLKVFLRKEGYYV